MKYFKRLAENVIKKQEEMFKTILVTGARQVGKTTMLKNIKPNIRYVTLDDMILNQSAVDEPELFLKANKAPIIIDEIQYAPNLLRYIKINRRKHCIYNILLRFILYIPTTVYRNNLTCCIIIFH